MDEGTYAAESAVEQYHWWFVVRRHMVRSLIQDLRVPHDSEVLDVGTGTGTNLRLLRDMGFTKVRGLDRSSYAIRWCAQKGFDFVQQGDVCSMPFANETFDLILATDIVEHVEDDAAALRQLQRITKRSGRVIMTVPAFPALWGLQDEVSHHKRRYSRGELQAKLEAAGLECETIFYFNFLLFVPIWLARQMLRLFRVRPKSENDINTPFLNWLLRSIFSWDVRLAKVVRPPFGVSLLIVAKRKQRRGAD